MLTLPKIPADAGAFFSYSIILKTSKDKLRKLSVNLPAADSWSVVLTRSLLDLTKDVSNRALAASLGSHHQDFQNVVHYF